MNLRLLLLAISYTVVLAASVPVEVARYSADEVSQVQKQQQQQETAINLNSNELKSPYYLKINTLNAKMQLNGQIKVNGKFFQKLDRNLKINLSSYLTSGKNTITVTGRYYPARDSVQIELMGINNQVSQATGGNGYLNQRIIIEVK